MASKINATNINGDYPVAGQDNNSQGFRDNFTNIRNNFSSAALEISDLQDKVVLKSALNDEVLDNNFDGTVIRNARFIGSRETVIPIGSTSGTVSINYASASFFTLSTSDDITLEFNNPTPTDTLTKFRIRIDVTDTAHTVTIPSFVTIGVDSIRGLESSVLTFDETGVYEFEFSTTNEGGNYSIRDLSRNTSDNMVYWGDSEFVEDQTAASLDTAVSLFNTQAAEDSTLVAGEEGQIKVLAKTNVDNSMTVTVSQAGWKDTGSGTVSFDAIGQACTLLFINARWYCIGNNGATFT